MTSFFLGHYTDGSFVQEQIGFQELVSLIKGTSIVSLADWNEYIEFGLSENLMLRITKDGGVFSDVQTTVLSTLNSEDGSPVRAQLINDGEEPSVQLLEERLYNLRQVYAIILLLETGRSEELAELLLKNPGADVEQELLNIDERLHIQAAGPGSLWVVLQTAYKKISSAPQFALNMLSLVYGEGRQLLLRRARASTIKQEEEARAAWSNPLELLHH